MSAIWKSPTIFLHQGDEGETKQFLLSFLLCCEKREKELFAFENACLYTCLQTWTANKQDQETQPTLTSFLYITESAFVKRPLPTAATSNPYSCPVACKGHCLMNFLHGTHYVKIHFKKISGLSVFSLHLLPSSPSHKHH